MVADNDDQDETEEKPLENIWLEVGNDSLQFKPVDPRRSSSRGSGRSVKFLLAFLVALALGAAWFVWGGELFGSKTERVPLIKAAAGPIKVRPERPGGLEVPNRDKLIYDRLEKDPPKSITETLLPRPEVPLVPQAKPPLAAVKKALVKKTLVKKAPKVSDMPLVAQAKRQPAPALPPAVPLRPALGPGKADKTADQAQSIRTKAGQTKAGQTKAGRVQTPLPKEVIAAIRPPPVMLAPAQASPPADSFLIQIAALRSAEAARQEWLRLSKKHEDLLGSLKLTVVRADLGTKGIYFRLRAGPFMNRETAKSTCLSLAQRKIGCMVIRPGT